MPPERDSSTHESVRSSSPKPHQCRELRPDGGSPGTQGRGDGGSFGREISPAGIWIGRDYIQCGRRADPEEGIKGKGINRGRLAGPGGGSSCGPGAAGKEHCSMGAKGICFVPEGDRRGKKGPPPAGRAWGIGAPIGKKRVPNVHGVKKFSGSGRGGGPFETGL